jgi:putative transposase
MLWAWLSQAWRGRHAAIDVVKPGTVIGWHRRSFRLFWTWRSRQRTGRPGVPPDVRALIRELSTANPLWGAPRLHGEWQKIGISVSQSTVAKYMRRRPHPPSQTWRTFLTNHANQIMAADLFVVPTVTFRLLFAFVILAHDRRRIVHVAVTEHPTTAWARGTWVSPPRSRCDLYRRRGHRRRHEHQGGAHGRSVAVAPSGPAQHATRARIDSE